MDSMQMMMIIGVVFLIFVGIMGGIVLIAIKKMSNDTDVPTSKDAKTAQDFLPFKDIRDSMIDLGGFEYRAIIECESINYDLKTEQEKEMIDASFQRFLDSLIFPITFHIQTRTIDNTRLLTFLEQEMIETVKEYNHLYDYANGYLEEMIKINETIGNNKHKKKYVIVPFSDSASLTYSSDAEKYEEALK
ncbi:MAG: hypothetical protein IJH34_02335, partial [Romboutsia sp.]|nr:hypothetical protein [Romboutsia sp.]